MYNVYVPMMNRELSLHNKEVLIRELKRVQPTAVFLVFDRIICNPEMLEKFKALYIKNKLFLEKNGFKVYTWLAPTIGYGGTANPFYGDNGASENFTHIKFAKGTNVNAYCPLDERFVDAFIQTLLTVCETGTELILFEDDFTLSGGKIGADVACCCDLHRTKLCEMAGEHISTENLYSLLLEEKNSKYRKAWADLQGETLRNFATKIEKAVHEKYPNVRLGLSANSSSYELEGVTFPELCKIIAGKNKPFARLTGAPYWQNALTLNANVEAIRLQTAWCGVEIETITEGDTYPRPRYAVAANTLEYYDMILRASGGNSGILKYMLDYTSSADYETGYVDRHVKNAPHYTEIEKRFEGKQAVGINVFETMDMFCNRDFEDVCLEDMAGHGYLPTVSQWFLMENSIPTTYNGKGASLIFGENAKYVTDEMLANGVILDAHAAKILMEKGVDIGATAYQLAKTPHLEHFKESNEYTAATIGKVGRYYDFTVSPNAKILSEFKVSAAAGLVVGGSDFSQLPGFIACYLYENDKKQKFMVYAFVATAVYTKTAWHNGLFRNYERQKQLISGIQWLQDDALPAVCTGNPFLYVLCKKDENSMAVGLWNLFCDEILHPTVKLGRNYSEIDFYNCNGCLSGDTVTLDNEILPYGFAFFTVKL